MSSSPDRKRIVSICVRTLLATGVLWLLFSLIEPDAVLDSFWKADVLKLLGAVALVPFHLAFRALRWNILLRASGIQERMAFTARVVLAGYPFSAVTPGELGDIVVRSRFHRYETGGRVPTLVVLDKLLQGLLIILAGVPSIVFILTASASLAVASFIAVLAIVALSAKSRKTIFASSLARRIAARVNADRGLESLYQIPRRAVLSVVLLAGFTLATFVTQEYLLLNAVTPVSFSVAWTGYWSVLSVQMLFPFFLAGLGIREGAHVYFFGLLGVGASHALTVSLLMFTVNILFPSLVGLVIFLTLPKRSEEQ